jgi:hypothetical protein
MFTAAEAVVRRRARGKGEKCIGAVAEGVV